MYHEYGATSKFSFPFLLKTMLSILSSSSEFRYWNDSLVVRVLAIQEQGPGFGSPAN